MVSDVETIRQVLDEAGGQSIRIVSKVENHEGLVNFDSILQESDGIMVRTVWHAFGHWSTGCVQRVL